MRSLLRNPWIIAGVVAVAVVGFLLFRPDTLFVDDAVDESLEDAFSVPTSVVEEPAPDAVSIDDDEPVEDDSPDDEEPVEDVQTTTTTAEPAGPVAVLAGSFYGIDHTASGSATIYEQDGAHVLRFEDDTDIQNGPDLFVWLVPAADYEGGTPEDFIDLGKLKGNLGGQNYALGDDFEPGEWTVLIWCKRFSVPFAAAPLA